MLKFYLNRELAERLQIPLSRWKRWSREFLPPDPLGGLRSGYARQYSLRDAFRVYVAGYLVSGVGYSIPEARRILRDLDKCLHRNVVAPYEAAVDAGGAKPSEVRRIDLLIVPVEGHHGPAFSYRLRTMTERKALTAKEPVHWQERFVEQILKPAAPKPSGCFPVCSRTVALTTLADHFFACLAGRKTPPSQVST